MSVDEKLVQMELDAKFDVADDNVEMEARMPDPSLFKDIKSKKTPPKVPKMFLSNDCIFNCAYCACRNSLDEKDRYCNNPRDMAVMAVNEAKANKSGVFLTSAICKSPNNTQEMINEAIKIMRDELQYAGYIHAKIMPGVDPFLIRQAGLYANRLSVNIEVAKSEGYTKIAKQKNKSNILLPMGYISGYIKEEAERRNKYGWKFASSQTTQLMAGSTDEDDRTIITLSNALYKKYDLKRVYYTPFQYKNKARGYELPFVSTPHWRMRRLYQADRLLQLYNFTPDEITPEQSPFLEYDIDPKAAWALRNLHIFPIEVNTAEFEMLLRIPGIGLTYANKIIRARSHFKITHEVLRKMGISLKKSVYFITCDGKYEGGKNFDNPAIRQHVTDITLEKDSDQLTAFGCGSGLIC